MIPSESKEELRIAEANRNLHAGIYDPLNTVLAEMAKIGSKRHLKNSQKRKLKKLAKKANKEFV